MPIDTSIYGGNEGVRIKTPSESLSEIAATRSSQAYARATQLQSDKAERQLTEETAIEEALKRSTKADGQLDEEQAVLNVAKVSPLKALELRNSFDKQKAEAAEAEAKFNSLSAAERVAHLKNFREKTEFLAEQSRGVLALPKDQREDAYRRMRIATFDALGEELPATLDENQLNQVVASSSTYKDQLAIQEEKAKKDRLLEFQAAIPTIFAPLAAKAAKNRTDQALFSSKVLELFADVPEAREYALKGIKGEQERAASPGVIETREQHDIDNVFKASKDFQDDHVTKTMETITEFVDPVSGQLDDYIKDPNAAKRQFTEQNLVVAFAKVADPNSVVMPGEFKRTLLGQPAAKELYNKAVAFLGGGGLGFDEKQLREMAKYLKFAKSESVRRARPAYELMRDRVETFDKKSVDRETKRWKHYFEETPKSFNKAYEGKSTEELQKRLEELNKEKGPA